MSEDNPTLVFGDRVVDLGAQVVRRHGRVDRLTAIETKLLAYLASRGTATTEALLVDV